MGGRKQFETLLDLCLIIDSSGTNMLLLLIAEHLLKQTAALEQQAQSTEQEAMKRAEEAEKQARIQQLELAVKELQERINAANRKAIVRPTRVT